MTTRVHDPAPGYRYSLAVHGEPPEGVEVLWGSNEHGVWSRWRCVKPRDTHWMRAPVDAPVPEECPFPLSREEFHSWQISDDPDERPGAGTREFKEWIWQLGTTTVFDYEMVQDYWRAAGCPGATPAAEEGEAQEGPWKTIKHHCGWEVYRGGSTTEFESAAFFYNDRGPRRKKRARRLASLLNRAHELEAALQTEREAREKAAAKVYELNQRLLLALKEAKGEAVNHASVLPANWQESVPAAVRSLVADLRKAESERDELKKDSQQFALTANALGASWKSAPEVAADLRARLEKAEARPKTGFWVGEFVYIDVTILDAQREEAALPALRTYDPSTHRVVPLDAVVLHPEDVRRALVSLGVEIGMLDTAAHTMLDSDPRVEQMRSAVATSRRLHSALDGEG